MPVILRTVLFKKLFSLFVFLFEQLRLDYGGTYLCVLFSLPFVFSIARMLQFHAPSKFTKGEIQNDETFAAAAATANHFLI
jgi:hypothetical protein